MKDDKQNASPRYLQDKDGKVELYAANDLEAARMNGWKEPTTVRGNGEPWNVEPELEGEKTQADAIGEVAKANAERQSKIDAQRDKDVAEQAKNQPDPPAEKADFRVEIVEAQKPAKGKK